MPAPRPRSLPAPQPAPVHYTVQPWDLQAHRYRVTLTLAAPASAQVVSLPVWIPGSYLVREFARHVQALQARQGRRRLALQQLDKCSWRVDCRSGQPLTLQYEVYAFDPSVRSAWLDSSRGFFNATSLCLRVAEQADLPHALLLRPPRATRHWRVATGLSAVATDARGFGLYLAADYDELVDCPVEMGPFWRGSFEAEGIPHDFVVAGALPDLDGPRLLADAQKICETALRFWHDPASTATPTSGRRRGKAATAAAQAAPAAPASPPAPYSRYVFLLHAVHEGYGGLEHRNSTALICKRDDLPQCRAASAGPAPSPAARSEGYITLLGLISHEHFHTWNVKCLRPAEFERYDYSRENPTEMLWFFEGFTSYYDDLLLCRAGLLGAKDYVRLLNKTINQVLQTPGRHLQSVAQASFDAWTRYYRPDENTPNATVSYYTKGALVALCLDLTLRAEGHSTLDVVMRGLWQRCQGGPMRENDLAEELALRGRRRFDGELREWVHGTGELPLRALLEQRGLAVQFDPAPLAQRLGLRVKEVSGSVLIQQVLSGGAAQRAGLCAGDEWLGVQDWRLGRLDELPALAGTRTRLRLSVARDRRLLQLSLRLPPPDAPESQVWRLSLRDPAAVQDWLQVPASA